MSSPLEWLELAANEADEIEARRLLAAAMAQGSGRSNYRRPEGTQPWIGFLLELLLERELARRQAPYVWYTPDLYQATVHPDFELYPGREPREPLTLDCKALKSEYRPHAHNSRGDPWQANICPAQLGKARNLVLATYHTRALVMHVHGLLRSANVTRVGQLVRGGTQHTANFKPTDDLYAVSVTHPSVIGIDDWLRWAATAEAVHG